MLENTVSPSDNILNFGKLLIQITQRTMLARLTQGLCARSLSASHITGPLCAKNGEAVRFVHHITLNLALHGANSNQTIQIPAQPMPLLNNTNMSINARALQSLSVDDVCNLLQRSGLQDIIPFIQTQNLTGLYLNDGVEHPQDLVDSGLNIIRAKTLFKRLVDWKANGVPLDFNTTTPSGNESPSVNISSIPDISPPLQPVTNITANEATYLNESDKNTLWMEQDYNAARWCSDQSALERLQQAANELNDPIAQMHLCLLYKHGCKHLPKNEQLAMDYATKALPWLQRQSTAGNAAAQYYYGYVLSHGLGVSENKTEGARYYQLSADQGLSIALNALGTCYLKGEGLPKYEEVGVSYLHKAIAAGSLAAEVNLALCYQNGFGVDINELEMVKIYRKIAELGYANVQHYFGLHYLDDAEGKQNYPKALHWLKLSAQQDYVDAIVTLGYMYETGKGVDKDAAVALEYYQRGAALGSKYAADAIERVIDLVEEE